MEGPAPAAVPCSAELAFLLAKAAREVGERALEVLHVAVVHVLGRVGELDAHDATAFAS